MNRARGLPEGTTPAEVRRELDAELAFHLEEVAAELVADGWDPAEAREEAERRFGDLSHTRRYCSRKGLEWARRERRRTTMNGWWNDVRFALRQLRSAPGFGSAVVVTLSLGIGAFTGIFALVDGVLLRPLPYEEPDRLVRIWDRSTRIPGWDRVNVNPANFRDWQARASSLEGLAGFITAELTLTADGVAERVPGAYVTAGLLEVLGDVPVLGRGPSLEEDVPGEEAPVVVLGHGTWRTRFAADPGVIGRVVVLEGVSHEVIGVTSERFRLPGVEAARQPDYLVPGGFGAPNGRGGHWLRAVARLGDGVTMGQARDEMTAIAAGLAEEYPDTNQGLTVVLESLHEAEVGESRQALYLFLAAVGVLLTIACANVAWLFLVRGLARRHEFSLRVALGAARGRVYRQLAAETLVVAALGSLGGALVATGLARLLPLVSGLDLPRIEEVGVGGGVLAAAVGVALAASLVAVYVPALIALGREPAGGLQVARGASTRHRARLADSFAAVQIALAVVLLAGAAVLTRSYLALSSVDPGFDAEAAAVVRIVVPESVYEDDARGRLYDEILERVRALPGVLAAGAGDSPPFQRSQNSRTSYRPEDMPPRADGEAPLMAWEEFATAGYFEALGVPLLEGRTFVAADRRDAPPVAVVNEDFARVSWPDESAIGKRFRYNGQSWEVVGVVGTSHRQGLDAEAGPEMFFPPTQHPWWTPSAVFLTVRASGDPADLVAPVRAVVRELAPDVPVGLTGTMESLVAASLAPARFRSLLVSAFALAALALAVVGVYAILAYAVSLRRREIGVRVALGAAPRSVRAGVLGRGLTVTGVGLGVGLGLWVAVGEGARSLLYEVSPLDPVAVAAVLGLFVLAGMAASYLPARRATTVDPVQALRDDR